MGDRSSKEFHASFSLKRSLFWGPFKKIYANFLSLSKIFLSLKDGMSMLKIRKYIWDDSW
jgi:hypothetical protein